MFCCWQNLNSEKRYSPSRHLLSLLCQPQVYCRVVETKESFVLWWQILKIKRLACKQIRIVCVNKARFKRRTLQVPNLISIWVDPNPVVDSHVEPNLVKLYCKSNHATTACKRRKLLTKMAGKMWERQIVEMMNLFFLHERSRRVAEGDSRCG